MKIKKYKKALDTRIICHQKGMTLLSLVVTIIVLIILSGIAIMLTVGDNGIITRANETKKIAEIAEQREQLELSKSLMIMDGRELTVEEYLEQLKKDGIIDENDIIEDEDSNLVVMGNNVYEIEIDENGSIETTYVGESGKLLPKFSMEITEVTTNKIKVEIKAKRAEEYVYYIKNIDEGEEYKQKEKGTREQYEFIGLKNNNKYKIKVQAINKNGIVETESEEIITVELGDLLKEEITFTYSTNAWTRGAITVTAETTVELPEGYRLQTSKDAENWEDSLSQTFETNGTIYARLYDGINETGHAIGEVEKIDKLPPDKIVPSITTGANTVVINASSAKDADKTDLYGQSGIKEIWYSIDGGLSWQTNDNKAQTIYQYTGLPYDTQLRIKVKIIDNANNETITDEQSASLTLGIATVGDCHYDKIQDAINSIESSGTVVVLADVTENTNIPSGKTITLNINGKTVTGSLSNAGTLTLQGGTLTSSGVTVTNTGTMTLASGTVNSTINNNMAINNSGTFTLDGGTITAPNWVALSTRNTAYIKSGTITARYGIDISTGKVTMSGGNITGSVLCEPGAPTVDITGGSISFIQVMNGTTTLSGNVKCGALSLSSGYGNPIVNINGGTYSSSDNLIRVKAGTCNITNGSFYSSNGHTVRCDGGTTNIKGGTFTNSNSNNYPTIWVESGILKITGGTISKSTNNNVVAINNKGGTCTISGATINGGTMGCN